MRKNDTDSSGNVDTDLDGGVGTGPITPPVAPPGPAPAAPTAPSWSAATLAAPGSLGAAPRVAAIAKPIGCELWWLGADGSVTGVWSQPGDPWGSYQLAGPGSAAAGAGITAISKGGDLMEVWWVGPDGSVQAAYHEGGWQRYELAGAGSAATTADIAAIAKGGDLMEVWWVGPDGSVQAAYHDGGWQRYQLAGAGSAATTGGPTAVSKGGDLMELWWVAPDSSMRGAWHDSDWHSYELTGPGVASTSCRLSAWSGTMRHGVTTRLWWIGPTGQAWQSTYDGAWDNQPVLSGAAHPAGAIVGFAFNPETVGLVWGGADGSLVDAVPGEVTHVARVSGGRALRGVVGLTLRADGSSEWWGDVTNDTAYGYNYAVSAFPVKSGLPVDLAGAHHGRVCGYAEPGSSDDLWQVSHPARTALAGRLGSYRFASLATRLEHSVDVVDYLEAVLDDLFQVASGIVMTKVGAVIVLGAEVVSLISTGSLVPGAVLAGGVVWLTGPAGMFVRVLVDAAGDNGRQLTDDEYGWANDMAFAGALPPIDTLRLTPYRGIGDRPFTFPTLNGPTLLNVGPDLYGNIHKDETTIIHELVHACQIAHSSDVLFTATAMVTQASNTLGSDVYDYGAAGFDYTGEGLEAQAQIVSDWFLGRAEFPKNPEDRTHTGQPRDPQSPYYRYLTDNVRLGRF